MLPVQKKVPLPDTLRLNKPARRKYPFDQMEVGDMFFVPNKDKNTLATHASTVGAATGRKFSTRLTYMCMAHDGWTPCESDEAGAVLGVGVWRTA